MNYAGVNLLRAQPTKPSIVPSVLATTPTKKGGNRGQVNQVVFTSLIQWKTPWKWWR